MKVNYILTDKGVSIFGLTVTVSYYQLKKRHFEHSAVFLYPLYITNTCN